MTMRTDYAILRGAKSTSTMSDHNDVIGYVESIDQELVVHGWATNTDYAEGLAVKIFARDALLCSTLCNIYRPDIIGPNGRALRCGFRAPLPAGSLKHLITDIRIEAVGKELEGSPCGTTG